MVQIDAILAVFDIAPPPHRRITTPSLIVAFAYIHTQAGTTTLGTGSAVRGGQPLFLGENRQGPIMVQMDAILAVFDIAPPPHRRITFPSLIVAFAYIHTQAETTTLGTGSAVWGRQPLFLGQGENRVQLSWCNN